jgi:hypothetical protein
VVQILGSGHQSTTAWAGAMVAVLTSGELEERVRDLRKKQWRKRTMANNFERRIGELEHRTPNQRRVEDMTTDELVQLITGNHGAVGGDLSDEELVTKPSIAEVDRDLPP